MSTVDGQEAFLKLLTFIGNNQPDQVDAWFKDRGHSPELVAAVLKCTTAETEDSLLHRAVDTGNPKTVQVILMKRCYPTPFNRKRLTPLHIAARDGDLEICKLLVKYLADIHAVDDRGKTPKDLAEIKGHESVAAWLTGKMRLDHTGVKLDDDSLATPDHSKDQHVQSDRERIESLTKTVSSLKSQTKLAQLDRDEALKEISKLHELSMSMQKDKDLAEEKTKRLEAKVSDLKSKVDTVTKERDYRLGKLENLNQEITAERGKVEALTAERDAAVTDRSVLQAEFQKLADEKNALLLASEEKQRLLDELTLERDHLNNELKERDEALTNLQKEHDERLAAHAETEKRLMASVEELTEELNNLRSSPAPPAASHVTEGSPPPTEAPAAISPPTVIPVASEEPVTETSEATETKSAPPTSHAITPTSTVDYSLEVQLRELQEECARLTLITLHLEENRELLLQREHAWRLRQQSTVSSTTATTAVAVVSAPASSASEVDEVKDQLTARVRELELMIEEMKQQRTVDSKALTDAQHQSADAQRRFNDELAKVRAELDEERKQSSSLKATIADRSRQREDETKAMEASQKVLVEKEAELKRSADSLQEAVATKRDLEVKLTKVQRQLEDEKTAVASLRQSTADRDHEFGAAQGKLNAELNQEREKVRALEVQLATAKVDLEKSRAESRRKDAEHGTLLKGFETEASRLSDKVRSLEIEKESLAASVKNLEGQLKDRESTEAAAVAAQRQLEQTLHEEQQKRHALELATQAAEQAQPASTEASLTEVKGELEARKTELAAAQAQVGELQKKLTSLELALTKSEEDRLIATDTLAKLKQTAVVDLSAERQKLESHRLQSSATEAELRSQLREKASEIETLKKDLDLERQRTQEAQPQPPSRQVPQLQLHSAPQPPSKTYSQSPTDLADSLIGESEPMSPAVSSISKLREELIKSMSEMKSQVALELQEVRATIDSARGKKRSEQHRVQQVVEERNQLRDSARKAQEHARDMAMDLKLVKERADVAEAIIQQHMLTPRKSDGEQSPVGAASSPARTDDSNSKENAVAIVTKDDDEPAPETQNRTKFARPTANGSTHTNGTQQQPPKSSDNDNFIQEDSPDKAPAGANESASTNEEEKDEETFFKSTIPSSSTTTARNSVVANGRPIPLRPMSAQVTSSTSNSQSQSTALTVSTHPLEAEGGSVVQVVRTLRVQRPLSAAVTRTIAQQPHHPSTVAAPGQFQLPSPPASRTVHRPPPPASESELAQITDIRSWYKLNCARYCIEPNVYVLEHLLHSDDPKLITELTFDSSHGLLSKASVCAILDLCHVCTNIISISLIQQRLGTEACEQLYSVGVNHPSLTQIDLEGNLISKYGSDAILRLARQNNRVKKVSLQRNPLMTEAQLQAIDYQCMVNCGLPNSGSRNVTGFIPAPAGAGGGSSSGTAGGASSATPSSYRIGRLTNSAKMSAQGDELDIFSPNRRLRI